MSIQNVDLTFITVVLIDQEVMDVFIEESMLRHPTIIFLISDRVPCGPRVRLS